MELKRSFRVACTRDEVVERLGDDSLLLELLPGDTELVSSKGDRRTTRTRYTALGQEGVATFHFTYLMDGNLHFEKQCDGRVWRELRGEIAVEEAGEEARVELSMRGRTKALVPEFTIKGPMDDQMEQMATALEEALGG